MQIEEYWHASGVVGRKWTSMSSPSIIFPPTLNRSKKWTNTFDIDGRHVQCKTKNSLVPSKWPCALTMNSPAHRAPARCLGGNGFNSHWGLRFFFIPHLWHDEYYIFLKSCSVSEVLMYLSIYTLSISISPTFHLVLWGGSPLPEHLCPLLFFVTTEMSVETTSAKTPRTLLAHNSWTAVHWYRTLPRHLKQKQNKRKHCSLKVQQKSKFTQYICNKMALLTYWWRWRWQR